MQRRLGPFSVGAIGLGCMNLSHAYGAPIAREQGERVLRAAVDAGVTHFDTAALYGFGANEELVGRALAPVRSQITLASKGGMAGVRGVNGAMTRVIDGRPETIRRNCEDSLRRLGAEVIDVYYLHRWDKRVPIAESVGAMGDLVSRGLVRAIGLSEVSGATIMRAHAEYPVSAVQSEYSLWTRNPEYGALAACRETGATFVAFSPLGRGFLTGAPPDVAGLDAKDIRRAMPRFSPDVYEGNLRAQRRLADVARAAECTPAQLALGWTLSRGLDVIAIPGTTREAHLRENLAAAALSFDAATLAAAEEVFSAGAIAGARYNEQTQAEIDAEETDAAA
ncbi:MAG: aldo/keto reductase [Hyphomicrobiales bacterium]|nr:aldo/keto reductase [Hyphomicrobiales bacterium]